MNYNMLYIIMDQGEPGLDYNDTNLNPLECDICKQNLIVWIN